MNLEQQVFQLLEMGVPMDQIASQLNVDRRVVEDIFSRSIGNVNTEIIGAQRPPTVDMPPANLPFDDNMMVSPAMVMPIDIGVPSFGEDDIERPDRRPPMRMFQDNETLLDIADQSANPEIVNIVHGVVGENDEKDEIVEKMQEMDKNATEADEALLDGAERKLNSEDPNIREEGVKLANSVLDQSNIPTKEKLDIYREFAKELYSSDEAYQELINPKDNLPLFLLGASLVQQGAEGKNLGEALPTALTQYFTGKIQQRGELRKLKLSQLEKENELAMNLYIADRDSQAKLANTLNNQTRKLYKITGLNNPVGLTSAEVGYYTQNFPGFIQDDWGDEYGKFKTYTIYNKAEDGTRSSDGIVTTRLLTQQGAVDLEEEGFIVVEGNQVEGNKLYKINGRNMLLSASELKKYQDAGAQIEPGAQMRTIKVVDKADGITKQIYLADYNDNKDQYNLVDTGSNLIIDSEGNVIFSQGGGQGSLAGFMTETQLGKKQSEIEKRLAEKIGQRDAVLITGYNVFKLLDDAQAANTPILFGTAGGLTTLGKRVINEFEQLEKIFDRNDYGYRGFIDANNNGIRDPEEKTLDLNTFKEQFGDKFAESSLGQFFQSAGLGRKALDTLVFTLALQSAALNNQKGRDISDKDIERFLMRAGGKATNEAEFRTLVGQLMKDAITSFDTLADGFRADFTRVKQEGQEDRSFFDVFVKPFIEEEENHQPYKRFGDNRTIAELREEYGGVSFMPNNTSSGVVFDDPGAIEILQGGDQPSGDGDLTVHQVFMTDFYPAIISKDNRTLGEMLAKYANDLGRDSAEYKALNDYISRYRNKLLKDE